MIENKRSGSILIPYKKQSDGIEVYLQKRSATMKTLPNYFGFWGGGLENNETPEAALVREVKEELDIDLDLSTVELFNRYEFLRSIKHVYIFEATDDWDQKIKVGEGDFGKWFLLEDAFKFDKIIFEDKVILNDLERIILQKSIR